MAGTLTKGTANLWLDTANPGASEPYVTKGNFWENTSTANIFFCNDPTAGIQSWLKVGVLTSALTQYGVLVADANSNITNISVGATGTVLSGNTGDNPSFTATPTITSISIGSGGPTITSGGGAPSSSQPKGSLYLRTDGSGVNDRMYVATDAVGTWTAVVTVA